MLLKLIALASAAIPLILFLRAMLGRRQSKLGGALREAKKQIDLAIYIFIAIIGCTGIGSPYASATVTYSRPAGSSTAVADSPLEDTRWQVLMQMKQTRYTSKRASWSFLSRCAGWSISIRLLRLEWASRLCLIPIA